MIPSANFNFFEIFLNWKRSAFQKRLTCRITLSYQALHDGVKDGVEYGVPMVLKHGVEYGVPMVLKTWGEIWGANGF